MCPTELHELDVSQYGCTCQQLCEVLLTVSPRMGGKIRKLKSTDDDVQMSFIVR